MVEGYFEIFKNGRVIILNTTAFFYFSENFTLNFKRVFSKLCFSMLYPADPQTFHPINLIFLHVILRDIICNVAYNFFDILISWIFINVQIWFFFSQKIKFCSSQAATFLLFKIIEKSHATLGIIYFCICSHKICLLFLVIFAAGYTQTRFRWIWSQIMLCHIVILRNKKNIKVELSVA